MNYEEIKKLLMSQHSRSYTDFVGEIMKGQPELVEALWHIYLLNEEPVSRRAAWIIDTASEKRPEWIEPYLPKLMEKLQGFTHDGMKRHALRMHSRTHIREEWKGQLTDICFKWLLSPTESVAVKMFCMTILYRISKEEPDILQELYDTIDFQMEDGTPGFKSIGRKMLADIDRDIMLLKTANV